MPLKQIYCRKQKKLRKPGCQSYQRRDRKQMGTKSFYFNPLEEKEKYELLLINTDGLRS